MSSHYLYIKCVSCEKIEAIYTGAITTEEFYDNDWEGEFVPVPRCIACQNHHKEVSDATQ